MHLEHVPLDDVIFILRWASINFQPLWNLDIQQWISRNKRCAVLGEIFMMWNQRRIDLMVWWQKICCQIRMVELRLTSYVAERERQLDLYFNWWHHVLLTCNSKHLVDSRCAAKTAAFLHAPTDATNEWSECCDQYNTCDDYGVCSR